MIFPMMLMRGAFKFLGLSILLLSICVPLVVASPENLVGKAAPIFALKNVMGGETVSLEALKGKVIVLDFWATWCGPCKEAIPHVGEIWRLYKGQDVLAISIDLREDEDTVKKFVLNNQMNWIIVIDRDGGVAKKYDVTAIPTLFIIDQGGTVRYAHVGFFKELRDELSKRIIELLKEKSDSIICGVSPSSITIEESMLVSGTLSPGRSTPITLKLTRPDGSSYTISLVTKPDGSYSHKFTPDRVGSWSVLAIVGNVASMMMSFEVRDKPMFQNPTFLALIITIVVLVGIAAVILVRRSVSRS